MSTETVVATAAGVLIPWSNPLVDVIASEGEEVPRCSRCGLYAPWNVLGYGVDGSVCLDCDKGSEQACSSPTAAPGSLRSSCKPDVSCIRSVNR
jgi:hypothetical protein